MTERDLTTLTGVRGHVTARLDEFFKPCIPDDAAIQAGKETVVWELLAELFKRVKALEPKDSTWRCLVCGKPAIYPRPTCSKACDERGMGSLQAGKSVGAPKE